MGKGVVQGLTYPDNDRVKTKHLGLLSHYHRGLCNLQPHDPIT